MNVKDIKKIEMMSRKRKLKAEDEETKKIKVELYCVLCQTNGHILSEECVTSAMCFDCGIKGHVRRDCNEERLEIKSEIKFEKVKGESSDSENEYVEEEIPKDEPNDDMKLESESDVIEMITPLNMSKEYIEEDVEDKKNVKVEEYCILCQIHGHLFSQTCVVNLVCLACGFKGHVRRDCKEEKCELKHIKFETKKESAKYEEEYVEVEDINKSEPKTEMNLDCNSELTEVQEEIPSSFTSTGGENNETKFSMNLVDAPNQVILEDGTHYMKKCIVNLVKVNIKQIEEAPSKTNRQSEQEEVKYICQECNYESKHKANLRRHIQAQHEGIFFACQKCNYKANYEENLNQHFQAQHTDITFACPKCNYKAKYKNALSDHMKAEHEGIRHGCHKCNYQTKLKRNLRSHIQNKHKGVSYACQECSFETKNKYYLSKHMEANHEGISYDCKKCNYKAKYKYALTNHIQVEHKGIRYACKKCHYKTKSKSILSEHIKAEHDGVRHDCQKCNFQSKFKGNVAKHMKAKHGVIYACKKCSFETKYQGNLSKHMKAVH